MLHTDIPTGADVSALMVARGPASVSIYLESSPLSEFVEKSKLTFKDQLKTALAQVRESAQDREARLNADKIEELGNELLGDSQFWVYLSNSLAVFITPEGIRTFRLPNRLPQSVEVADRFNVKPLLRSITFAQTAFVLALSQNAVRLVEVTADLPAHTISVYGMPTDAIDALGVPSIAGRAPNGRIQGSEGQKVRLHQYARAVDQALRNFLVGHSRPLILVAAEPLASIFRSVNSYSNLLETGIRGNSETIGDAELADQVRPILDEYYAAQLTDLSSRFMDLEPTGRAQKDLAEIARSATFGAVSTLLVNIESKATGHLAEDTGAITFDSEDDASNYPLVDEIVRRVYEHGGTVLAVRAEDLPSTATEAAAILRFAQRS